jgi:hypothetical protein
MMSVLPLSPHPQPLPTGGRGGVRSDAARFGLLSDASGGGIFAKMNGPVGIVLTLARQGAARPAFAVSGA